MLGLVFVNKTFFKGLEKLFLFRPAGTIVLEQHIGKSHREKSVVTNCWLREEAKSVKALYWDSGKTEFSSQLCH